MTEHHLRDLVPRQPQGFQQPKDANPNVVSGYLLPCTERIVSSVFRILAFMTWLFQELITQRDRGLYSDNIVE